MPEPSEVRSAELVLPCRELAATLALLVERLGFRLESIQPADDPACAVVSGHGLRLRLERPLAGTTPVLRFVVDDPSRWDDLAAAGLRLEAVAQAAPASIAADGLPPLEPRFCCTRAGGDEPWTVGRAGMLYRDLLPGRLDGRLVASHIRIPAGGPVPDCVHSHRVRFQMIYCRRGWVRVVYEDQGPPFVLAAGDCVLQPPGIRHRVLECSPGLEVIELAAPAVHETRIEHELSLPTPMHRPERGFEGQRFVRHERAAARFGAWRQPGFEARDLGIAAATGARVHVHAVRVARAAAASARESGPRAAEAPCAFRFLFVLDGAVRLTRANEADEPLAAGDALLVPGTEAHAFAQASRDLELLEVSFPADPLRDPA